MSEERKNRIKRKIKHYTPEIIVVLTVIAGLAAIPFIKKSMNPAELLIPVPNDGTKFLVLEQVQTNLFSDLDTSKLYYVNPA